MGGHATHALVGSGFLTCVVVFFSLVWSKLSTPLTALASAILYDLPKQKTSVNKMGRGVPGVSLPPRGGIIAHNELHEGHHPDLFASRPSPRPQQS